MPAVNKNLDASARRAGIELWRAKVPQRDIIKQLGDPDEGFGLCDSDSDYLRT
jgi:hypothetical protein